MRKPSLAVVVASAMLAAACSSPAADTSTPAADTPAGTTAAASPSPAAAAPPDAKALVDKLAAAGIGATNVAVQDENTDPNDLLGRPNGYIGRASADLPGGDTTFDAGSIDRGLVIEVWPDKTGADTRSTYIQETLKGAAALGTEYHYRTADGLALVRVTGKVKPSDAQKIETAVKGL